MASAEAVAAVIEAGGAHVPGLMGRLEERLATVAASHGDGARRARGRDDRRGRQAAATAARLRRRRARTRPTRRACCARAVAVELIHSATLVHDDVLDAAALRRGRPTVVATAGRAIATATGDLLFSRAFAELAANRRADELRVLSEASSALAQGELLQREDAWDLSVSRASATCERCDLKTARLFEAACDLGAIEGRGPASRCSGASGGASASPSRSSTTCSTCPDPQSAPASIAAPTCWTARSRSR